MAPSQSKDNARDGQDDLSQVKRKLAWRMGIAGLMIVALLGGLALFDRLTSTRDEPEVSSPPFTAPVPVPKKSVTQALGSVEPAPGGSQEEKKETTPESTAAPADRAAPVAALPPPEVVAQPSAERTRQRARPQSASSPPTVTARASEPRGEAAVVSPRAEVSVASPSPAQVTPRQPPTLPRLLSGYTLQAGVFADARRAEDLHARLVQEGIPATLETRVLVGPFRNRDEAERARAKMMVMGIDALQLPKVGKQ